MGSQDSVRAGELSREACEILRAIPGPAARAELGLALSNQAILVSRQGRHAECQQLFRESISIQEELVARSPQRVSYRVDLASTYNNRGQRFLEAGDFSSAERDLVNARKIFEELVAQYPDVPVHLTGLATVLDNLGTIWERTGRPADAADAFAKALEFQEAACQRSPDAELFGSLLNQHRKNLNRVRTLLNQADKTSRS
jgi:tetratricopeptide (TPR) repeat protein